MLRTARLLKIFSFAFLLCSSLFALPKYNGGNFISFSYDGDHQTIGWILYNLGDTAVQKKLDNTFAEFSGKGFNAVAFIIAPSWPGLFREHFNSFFPFASAYPKVDSLDDLIARVNQLMAIASRHGLKSILRMAPPDNAAVWNLDPAHAKLQAKCSPKVYPPGFMPCSDRFQDYSPNHLRTKKWLQRWYDRLDRKNLVEFNISNEFQVFQPYPHEEDNNILLYKGDGGCAFYYGGPCTMDYQGAWVMDIYHFLDGAYPGGQFSFQLTPMHGFTKPGGGKGLRTDSSWFRQLGDWIADSLPHVNAATLEIYYDSLPLPKSDTAYYVKSKSLIAGYLRSKAYVKLRKPLWIDEYGMPMCTSAPSRPCPEGSPTEEDQDHFMSGTLRAIKEFGPQEILGQALWAASNDAPFMRGPKGDTTYGLFSGYDASGRPIPRKAWKGVDLHLPKP